MPDPVTFDLTDKRIWVTGHRGMVGGAVARRLGSEGCTVLTTERAEVDLRRQTQVEDWVQAEKPDAIVIAAGLVGGIEANRTRPAEFLFDNLSIVTHIIEAAHRADVPRVMFLASNCMYPRAADQPVREDSLLTGPFEPTNEWYAMAKVAGLKMCQAYRRQYGRDYICVVPTGLYGPGDNFDPAAGHVVPGVIRRMHDAKHNAETSFPVWGTGTPRREFMYVDDGADALTFLLMRYSDEAPINISGGEDVSIGDLAKMIAETVGYDGSITFDTSKPDGMPKKALEGSRLKAMGWRETVGLAEGLRRTYDFFLTDPNVRLGAGH